MRKLSAIVVSLVFVGACQTAKGVTPTTKPTTTTSSTTSTTTSTSTSTTTTSTTTSTTTTTMAPKPAVVNHFQPQTVADTSSSGSCGGDLPPCWIMKRESRGQIRAKNPVSSASGKWQMLDSTWNGYGGYAHASDAPEAVQDAKARTLALCNWQPPNYCA